MTITEAQRRIPRRPAVLRTRDDYRRAAKWLELESQRGYASAPDSLRYAQNMRWAAEVCLMSGPATWVELRERGNP